MKGTRHIEVKNKKCSFKFDLRRNITIVCGNSGTGKTTLFTMLSDYSRLGEKSGVQVTSENFTVCLTDTDWENQLKKTKESIVFIDEGSQFVSSSDFARAVKKSDNYFVIFTREALHELPYSVEEIYKIHTSGKIHTFVPVYKSNDAHMYTSGKETPYDTLITEDSGSGFAFYEEYLKNSAVKCVSAKTNSGVFDLLRKRVNSRVLVVADGAAFGSEMNRVMELGKRFPEEIGLCLPESFEWLILKSGLIDKMNPEVPRILASVPDYVESKEYFSWENYFEKLLADSTHNSPEKADYNKSRLNRFYKIESNQEKIVSEIEQPVKNHI